MKKLLAIALVCVMLLSMAACTNNSTTPTEPPQNNTQPTGSGSETPTGGSEPSVGTTNYPDYVNAPISIEFWHSFGSGAQAEYMNDAVKRFNDTNEYGIHVNATYIGDYATLRTQVTTAIGAKQQPQVSILGISNIVAATGVLADMTPYVERDGVNLDDYLDGVKTNMYYDGELTNMPYARSSTVLYYNVDMLKAAGYDAPPTTVDEMVEIASAIYRKTGKKGLAIRMDVGFIQEAFIRSINSIGLVDEDESGSTCLSDGSLLKHMTDWRSWIDAGWCVAPAVSSAQATISQLMYNGDLAMFIDTTAIIGTVVPFAKESGVNVGVAPQPAYNGTYGVGGGGDIAIIEANNTQQQIAASWEFVKWMMSDEEVANRSMAIGFMPTSNGAAALMEDFFAQDPNMAAGFEARKVSVDVPSTNIRSEWHTQVSAAFSYVIQDGSMTPEKAIEYLEDMYHIVFY